MKKINLVTLTALILVSSSTCFADTQAGAASQSAALSASKSNATGVGSQDQGQALLVGGTGNGAGLGNNNSTNTAVGSDLSKAVGFAAAPALTTTLTETCMGSTSAGAGFSGGSFSFGTTWRDTECVNRLNAREVKTFGDVQAAKEILCANDNVRESFKRVGRPCVLDGGSYEQASVATPVAAPVVEQTVAPATDATVHDDQDEVAQRNTSVLQKAEEARAAMRAKGY